MQVRLLFISTIFLTLSLLTACSSDKPEKEEYLLKVNDYTLTKSGFNSLLKFELDADRNFDISADSDTRASFLNDIVRKQLLIQEAKKMQMDRQEHFRKSIERYWESTLIRDLLNQKGLELQQETAVTPEEVTAYYQKNKDMFGGRTFEEVSEDIQQQLEQEKVSAMMEEWIDQLISNAEIDVSDPDLKEKMKTEVY